MGYTHYFQQIKSATPEQWAAFAASVKPVLDANAAILTGDYSGDEHVPVELTDDELCFNGIASDSHETFSISRQKKDGFNFCKTARKPYDKIVCVCLLEMDRLLPGCFDISSDGDETDDEWQEGLKLWREQCLKESTDQVLATLRVPTFLRRVD